MDITLMPLLLSTGRMPIGLLFGRFCVEKNIFGMLGPVISASRRPTLWPFLFKAMAKNPATNDLPTPPLPLITAMTCSMRLNRCAKPALFS